MKKVLNYLRPYRSGIDFCNNMFALLLLSASLVACQHKLDPTGPYAGDAILYQADEAIGEAHDILQKFIDWEAQYRSTLSAYPEIRQAADTVFTKGPAWF